MEVSLLKDIIIGLTTSEAKSECDKHNIRFRIKSEDGDKRMLTCDFRRDRINVVIKEGKIIEASLG